MILELTAAAMGGGMVGFFACAVMTAGKVVDNLERDSILFDGLDSWSSAAADLQEAHARATDALATKQSRIDRALEQVTPGANATVQRIARILKGDA